MNNTPTPNKTRDESMRSIMAVYTTSQALILILFFGSAPFIGLKIKSDEAMGVVELVLPILTGYVGLMLGYYFGTKAKS
jgi:hypothetical protein